MTFELTQQEGEFLVKLARETVEEYLADHVAPKPPEDTPKKLYEKCGVFVTINTAQGKERNLRGCIGYPYPTNPLVEAVIDSAVNASTEDPRFEPMEPFELSKVVFEVSVLTPPEQIKVANPKDYVGQVKVGEDGLIIESGWHKGLLLPQVPVEWNWDAEEFLCEVCQKAGLPMDAWLGKGVKLYKFKGIIFEEETPKGAIKRLTLKP